MARPQLELHLISVSSTVGEPAECDLVFRLGDQKSLDLPNPAQYPAWEGRTISPLRDQGQQYPVKTILKQDRLGFGLNSKESGPRVTHFSAHDKDAVRTRRERERVGKESSNKTKREMVKAAEREKRWEIRMRQYMST